MNIYIYGDSNTVGYVPNLDGYKKNANVSYYNKEDLWWHGLSQKGSVKVNAKCGRCVCHENRWLEGRNAARTFMKDVCSDFNCSNELKEIDLFIIMLGTNDFKHEYRASVFTVIGGLELLINQAKIMMPNASIVVVSPPLIKEGTAITDKYYVGGKIKTIGYDYRLRIFCEHFGYNFVSGINAEVGEDGEHLTIQGHKKLGELVSEKINHLKQMQNEEKE